MRRAWRAALAAFLVTSPIDALAQASEDPPICTDRPAKANATCTVPSGKFQLERSVTSWSLTKADGTRTEVSQLGGSVIKLGLTDRSDLQVAMAPYVAVNSKAGGVTDHVSGIGDVTVRYKHLLTGDGSSVHVALISFVKLPTAKLGMRNRKVEGGLARPISNRLNEQTNVVDHDVFVMPFDLRNAV